MNKKREIVVRIYLGYLAICLLGAAVVGKSFYIQTVEGKYYRSLADSLTIFPKKIQAERGNIYSADGRLLATSLPKFDLYIDFKANGLTTALFNEKLDTVSDLLANQFRDKTKEEYRKELISQRKAHNRHYLLKRNVDFTTLALVKTWTLFKLSPNKSGLIVEQKNYRLKPFQNLAERTIGFVNSDGKYVGLEGKYNEQLSGIQGEVMVQKLAGGVTIPLDAKEEIAPQPGKDIYTSIDVNLQDVAEDELLHQLETYKADHGCVVVMEVKTGRIKAIANLGMNKDSSFSEGYNYAVGETGEPGSTFKLATVLSLIEDGFATNDTKIEVGSGKKKFYDRTIEDHDAPETPYLTLKRAIEVSSNVAIATLADKNYAAQKEKFYNHLVALGFTKQTGTELPGEAKPIVPDYHKWSGVSVPYLAHGYGLNITPMHILTFYNAIANNGVMVQPHVVDKISEYNKTVDSTPITVVNPKICSDQTLQQLHAILEGVVEQGTATNLKTDYLKIAGKTGTAKIADNKNGYSKSVYQASFCGYFPTENPMYSMIVVVNSPSNGVYYGNVVAGTVFRKVADKINSLSLPMHEAINIASAPNHLPTIKNAAKEDVLNIYRFMGVAINPTDGEWLLNNIDGNSVKSTLNNVTSSTVPNVIGMGLKDALYLLETNGLKVTIAGKGIVHNQSIEAGATFRKGTQITIELS